MAPKKAEHLINEIVRIYTEEKIPAVAVANRVGCSPKIVYSYLHKHGVMRTHSEAHATPSYAYRKTGRFWGTNGWWQSTKTGRWEPADSKLEIIRMSQLDADTDVKFWTRDAPPILLPNGKRYIPDFKIESHTHGTIIEEVKAKSMLNHGKNNLKHATAEQYCRDNNLVFRIITEDEIGREAIKAFKTEGLMCLNQEEKIERRKLRNRELAKQYRAKYPDRRQEYMQANTDMIKKARDKYWQDNRPILLEKKKKTFKKFKEEQPEKYQEELRKTNERRNGYRAAFKTIAAALVCSGWYEKEYGPATIKKALTKQEIGRRYRAKKKFGHHETIPHDTPPQSQRTASRKQR